MCYYNNKEGRKKNLSAYKWYHLKDYYNIFMVMKYFHYSNCEIVSKKIILKKNQQQQQQKAQVFAIYLIVNILAKECIQSVLFNPTFKRRESNFWIILSNKISSRAVNAHLIWGSLWMMMKRSKLMILMYVKTINNIIILQHSTIDSRRK